MSALTVLLGGGLPDGDVADDEAEEGGSDDVLAGYCERFKGALDEKDWQAAAAFFSRRVGCCDHDSE